ncbi:MAG: hypothetical protein Q4D53_03760, partial [Leptotrichiaceae bacterium]|nr:hypothetical protein [Leptotrichiaceae bacterium]
MKIFSKKIKIILFSTILVLSFLFLKPLLNPSLKMISELNRKVKYKKFEREKEKKLKYRIDIFYKNFKVKFDINDYKIKATEYSTPFQSGIIYEIEPKKRPVYKSKYFNSIYKEPSEGYIYDEDKILTDNDYIGKVKFFKIEKISTFLNLLDYDGLRPYVLNELIYDKSKGNDFESIEKILDKNKVNYSFPAIYGIWGCGELQDNDRTVLMYVIDEKCKKGSVLSMEEKMYEYGEKFEKYFSMEREFKKIDWQEFMEYNNITPVIEFRFSEDVSEEHMKKVRDEIRKYYNTEDFIIVLSKG